MCLLAVVSCAAVKKPYTGPIRYDDDRTTWMWDAADIPIFWAFDCGFPVVHRNDVRNGFDYWDRLTPIDLFEETTWSDGCVDVDKDFPKLSMIIVAHSWGSSPRTKLGSTIMGSALPELERDNKTIVSMRLKFWKEWFSTGLKQRWSIVRHEVGHAVGLHHTIDADCIMHEYARRTQGLKSVCAEEKREFLRIYGAR